MPSNSLIMPIGPKGKGIKLSVIMSDKLSLTVSPMTSVTASILSGSVSTEDTVSLNTSFEIPESISRGLSSK